MKQALESITAGLFAEVGHLIRHMDAQAKRIAELESQLAARPADTDKLREAIFKLPLPNGQTEDGAFRDLSSWECEVFVRGALNMRKSIVDLVAPTAAQAPVREVPEMNDAKYSEAEKAIGKIIFQRYPRIQGHRCASITVGILEYMGLRHSALNYEHQEQEHE